MQGVEVGEILNERKIAGRKDSCERLFFSGRPDGLL